MLTKLATLWKDIINILYNYEDGQFMSMVLHQQQQQQTNSGSSSNNDNYNIVWNNVMKYLLYMSLYQQNATLLEVCIITFISYLYTIIIIYICIV